jgi:hypothetical protein
VTTTSETAFTQSAETVYDVVTNPENWTKTPLSRARTRGRIRLTPVPAVRDTFAVFCKGVSG